MESSLFLIGLYFLHIALEILISQRQYAFLKQKKKDKPILLDEKTWKEAAEYAIKKEQFRIISGIFSAIVFGVWVFGGLGFLNRTLVFENLHYKSVALILAFMAINFVLNLPFEIYSKFVIDEKFGFNKTTKELFLTDTLKSIILSVLLISLIVYAMSIFIASSEIWWLYSFFAIFALIILVNMLYPTIRALLFDKFESIETTPLGDDIKELLKKQGFKISGIFKVDASKRDTRLNAYFGGLGKTKRVVLFDTLIEKLSKNELLAVLGHELGHFKHKDILKNIAFVGCLLFATLFLFGNVNEQVLFGIGLENAPASKILFFLMFSPLVFFFISPFANYLSQLHEFSADEFGSCVQDRESMASALIKLSSENKSFPLSDRLYSVFYHSHPSVDSRVQRLKSGSRS